MGVKERKLLALNSVIEGLYASAADGSLWDAEEVRRVLGTDCCHLLFMSDAGMILDGRSSALAESVRRQYLEYWAEHDVRAAAVIARTAGPAVRDSDIFAGSELESSPVFEGFYEPNDMIHFAVGHQTLDNGVLCGISAHNGRSTGPTRTGTLQRINLLVPHLRQAARINELVRAAQARAAVGDSLLFQWGIGLLRCDASGRVHDSQGHAEAMLARFDSVIGVLRGRLHVRDPGGQLRLQSLLLDPNHGAPSMGPTIAVQDPRTGAALELTVLEFRPAREVAGEGDRLVLLRESGRPPRVDRHYLRRRFDLTPAEADVLAQLMIGGSVATIAEERGSTVKTIRSYLKTTSRKLACHSQAQLVATGWAAIGFVPQ